MKKRNPPRWRKSHVAELLRQWKGKPPRVDRREVAPARALEEVAPVVVGDDALSVALFGDPPAGYFVDPFGIIMRIS